MVKKEITQKIGMDLGRGYVKAYTEFNGIQKETMFKSMYSEGRNLDFSEYEKPMFIEFENEEYFIGLLAEKEGQTLSRNSKDSKITLTARILLAAALSQVAISDKVEIILGVPYKMFTKENLLNIKESYKGQTITVTDKINGGTKNILIKDISIFREADAALIWELRDIENFEKPIGIASVGFRTTELSYFEKGFKFVDKKSKSIEQGNKSAMENIKDKLLKEGIDKEVYEIDSSNDYDAYKKSAYNITTENIEQNIEDLWINTSNMDIYIAGGTALKMNFDKSYKRITDSQMATAKGLWSIAEKSFK